MGHRAAVGLGVRLHREDHRSAPVAGVGVVDGTGALIAGDGTPILTATAAAVVTINTARTPHAVRMHPPFYRTAGPARHARLRDARPGRTMATGSGKLYKGGWC